MSRLFCLKVPLTGNVLGSNGSVIPHFKKQMVAYDLLVIDDFGLMDLVIDKCRGLFEVIESRDCRKSTMIVSQFPVIKLWDLFKNDTYADACLSRMTSKAIALNAMAVICENQSNN